jgi:hypothetical protein
MAAPDNSLKERCQTENRFTTGTPLAAVDNSRKTPRLSKKKGPIAQINPIKAGKKMVTTNNNNTKPNSPGIQNKLLRHGQHLDSVAWTSRLQGLQPSSFTLHGLFGVFGLVWRSLDCSALKHSDTQSHTPVRLGSEQSHVIQLPVAPPPAAATPYSMSKDSCESRRVPSHWWPWC